MVASAAIVFIAGALPPLAASAETPPAHQPTATSGADHAPMSEGEVRKIDRAQGKLTLRHGEIRSLDMPPMTMVFRVADPGMLDRVKEGDRIRFDAERVGGAITVTRLEPLPR